MVEGLFRFAVPPKFYVAATLPPPPPYERRCKKLPWAEHSLSVAIVVERTLMKVEPGGGAKGTKFLELVDQQQQVAAAYDRLPAP